MAGKYKRYDACTPRPKHGGGTWWHRVGSAVESEEGKVTIFLDSYPMVDKERGSAVIMLFEPREEREKAESQRDRAEGKSRPAAKGGKQEEMDDEIPF